MFAIGDLVVHPMHGAGVIADIVQERIAGSTRDYYVFRMPVGGLLLKIPVASSQTVGLRAVVDRETAEQTARECYPEIRDFTYDILWNDLPKEVQEQLMDEEESL